jgi:hypothetical protein
LSEGQAASGDPWGRPAPEELGAFYAGYVARVPEGDVLAALAAQRQDLRAAAAAVQAAGRESHRYAAGKWTPREVFGHLIDAERVFGYRAYCIGRGEQASLPSFDENAYVAAAGADGVPLGELLAELLLNRDANLYALRRLDAGARIRFGVANGQPVTARALAYMLAGHVRHHLAILAERYLAA